VKETDRVIEKETANDQRTGKEKNIGIEKETARDS